MADRRSLLAFKVELSFEDTEIALKRICEAMSQVLRSNKHMVDFVSTSQDVYKLVISSSAFQLYEAVKAAFIQFAGELGNIAEQATEHNLLEVVNDLWNEYSDKFRAINHLLNYLERTYIGFRKLDSLAVLGKTAFKLQVLERSSITTALTTALLKQVADFREGHLIDQSVLRTVLSALISVDKDLKCYTSVFEKSYVEDLINYYDAKARNASNNLSWTDYINTAEEDLSLTSRLCEQVMPHSKAVSILTVAQTYVKMKPALSEDASIIEKLLIEDRHFELCKLLKLYSCIPDGGLNLLNQEIAQSVTSITRKLIVRVMATQKPLEVIQALIDARSKFCFSVQFINRADVIGNSQIDRSMQVALHNVAQVPSYLAIYMDALLRKSRKQHSSVTEMRLISAAEVVSLLPSIDLFLQNYKIFLADRLLHGNFDSESELVAINEIKLRSSIVATRPLQMMLNDYFKSSEVQMTVENTEVVLRALTISVWSLKNEGIANLPYKLGQVFELMQGNYQLTYANRKLRPMVLRGTVVLEAVYGSGKYDLVLTTAQAIVLMYLEFKHTCTIGEMMLNMQLDVATLMAHLIGLFKTGLLEKRTKLTKETVLKLKADFKSSLLKVKVPLKIIRNEFENTEVEAEVAAARRDLIDTAVIRVMKARRELKTHELHFEVIKNLESRFQANVSMIKVQVEKLLEREFLAFNALEDTYSYLA
mmetsp:Transcript_8703/g.17000  ORF Transcript_8703/g.17000 Transcript_8703/m.17000 type:complete len:707 (-) Transcript_8703:83-2203(-)